MREHDAAPRLWYGTRGRNVACRNPGKTRGVWEMEIQDEQSENNVKAGANIKTSGLSLFKATNAFRNESIRRQQKQRRQ